MILYFLIILQFLFYYIKSDVSDECEIGNYCTEGTCSVNGNCKIDIFNIYNITSIEDLKTKCECNIGFTSFNIDEEESEEDKVFCCYEQKSHFSAFMIELFLGFGAGHFFIGDIKFGLLKFFIQIFLCFSFCCLTYFACNKEHIIIINLNDINKKDDDKMNENIDNDELKELNENIDNDKNSDNESRNLNEEDEENKFNELLSKNLIQCPISKFLIFSSIILSIVFHIIDLLFMGLGYYKDSNGVDLALWY